MIWIPIIYIVYLGSILIASMRGAKDASFLPSYYFAGLLLGSIGMMSVIAGLQGLLVPPRFYEFDILIYIFYILPIGGLLGALSASVIFLSRNEANEYARRLSFIGALPLLIFCLWGVFSSLDSFDSYLSNTRDTLFWLFVFGFPFVWIVALWYFVQKRRRSVMV